MNMFRHNFNFKMNLTLKPPHNVRSSKTQHHPQHHPPPHPQHHPQHIKIVNNVVGDGIHNNHSRVHYLHESHGIGDSVFNLIFFNLIEESIIADNILVCYFAKNEYIQQLTQFINPGLINNVKLFSLDKKPQQSMELWINNPYFGYTFDCSLINSQGSVDYNDFYLNYFKHVLQTLTINANIQSIMYSDNDLLVRADAIPTEYKSVDILILNSVPYSGQYNYNKDDWDNYIMQLNSEFKIATTTKVDGVLCTFDENLTIKDIAALSTHAKVIIAINSGVFPGLLNVRTMETVKQFYIFDNRCHYSFPRFQNKGCITQISIAELNYYVTM